MISIQDVSSACRRELDALYGARLRQCHRFGSYARGEADEESGLDILVVLDRVDDYAGEVDRTSEIIGALSLRYGTSISWVFASEKEWRHGDTVFLQIVREEAIPL